MLREAAASLPGKASFVAGDATKLEDVIPVTEAAVATMGGLDTLVISTGSGGNLQIACNTNRCVPAMADVLDATRSGSSAFSPA